MTPNYERVPGLVAVAMLHGTTNSLEICKVPDGIYLEKCTKVIVEQNGAEHNGVCETDTVYIDRGTYEFIRAVWGKDFLPVKGRYIIQRFDKSEGG